MNIDDALDIADDGIYDDPAEIDRALLALAVEVRRLRERVEADRPIVQAARELRLDWERTGDYGRGMAKLGRALDGGV